MRPRAAEPKFRGAGLAGRLLVAQTLVVLTGALTAWLVAVNVGPRIFHEHLAQAHFASTGQVLHTERAYESATTITLSLALLAAMVAAMAVSLLVTRRIRRPVAMIAGAASEVAQGRYDVTVPPPGLGAEFDALASGFNQMSGQLRSVERTRSRLLADLGHEMRTPLATLEAYLEALEDGVATLDAPTARLLRSQTRRLARLSEDLGAVSRAEEGHGGLDRRPIQPAVLVTAPVDAVAEAYKAKGVRLLKEIDVPLPDLRVDPDRFGQVLGNLLDNALRHTPSGGTVTVSALTTPGAEGIDLALPSLVLSVTDTGEGIPAEHLPHVFERFYRVDAARTRDHEGSGIGLAIAKALVEAHGGQLTVTSAGTGQGSAFRIHIPSADPLNPRNVTMKKMRQY